MKATKERSGATRVLWLSTCAFTLLFNVWLMLGVLGISVRRELGLSDSQLEWLMASAILSGALFRLNFGIWADTYGGRRIMGWLLLGVAIPTYTMGIGKASVYKYIPDYFPEDIGAAGGVVGALGALGGFILPPAFGMLGRWAGIPQLAFAALLALTVWSLAWLHFTVVRARSVKEQAADYAAYADSNL